MNQKNFDYLKDQVKFTGFGDQLENDLKDNLQKQHPEFQIAHNTKIANDTVLATLHFKKSDQSDMYFFNKYTVSLKQENSPTATEQTFYINKGNNITFKEAYNLMNGRAINKDLTSKDGQVYNTWLQMSFKETDGTGNYKMNHYHKNYGYDLEKVLANHPIKELSNEQDKSRLIDSLNRGNRQSVTFMENASEKKYFIEANPKFKSINIYDGNMRRLVNSQSKDQREQSGNNVTASQEFKKEKQKQNDSEEDGVGEMTPKKRTKKRSQSMQ